MPRRPKPITDQLREAILQAEAKGMTRGEIARAAGLTVTAITTQLNGGAMKLENAERIAEAIGKRLTLNTVKRG